MMDIRRLLAVLALLSLCSDCLAQLRIERDQLLSQPILSRLNLRQNLSQDSAGQSGRRNPNFGSPLNHAETVPSKLPKRLEWGFVNGGLGFVKHF